MGNFDDAFAKAKDMAEVIGQKSAQALELSRLKLNEAEAKNKLGKAYEQLGRVYYGVLTGKPENAQRKAAAMAEIERQTKLVEALGKQIRAAKM